MEPSASSLSGHLKIRRGGAVNTLGRSECCRSQGTVCRGMGRAGQDRFPPVLEYGTECHKDA